jgi:hypothetical protein
LYININNSKDIRQYSKSFPGTSIGSGDDYENNGKENLVTWSLYKDRRLKD